MRSITGIIVDEAGALLPDAVFEIRREEAFRKSFEAEKMGAEVRARKLDELFKKAKESLNEPPPKCDIDL